MLVCRENTRHPFTSYMSVGCPVVWDQFLLDPSSETVLSIASHPSNLQVYIRSRSVGTIDVLPH